MEENRDFRHPKSATHLASNHINLGKQPFIPLTVIFQKRLKIKKSVRQKMGAEQRGLNRYEQRREMQDF